ncbi:hypothetical protein GcM1_195023 [Golovinomyces cichoracearum]|uniref:Protein RCR2 n=1 Tax=Golovinomyces cichoracearum TaxID=62708 RepID=A0A420J0G7_9PEZI|nr:hypothetical protein GcM1_195023 [Golovinomyces cichoracearum]
MNFLSNNLPSTPASALKNTISRRAYGYCVRYGHYGYYSTCRRSVWSRFGRWVLAGILIILGLIAIAVTLCCITRRNRQIRRRKKNQGLESSGSNYFDGPPPPQQQQQYAPPPGAPPKYGGPEPYGGVTQPANAYVQ